VKTGECEFHFGFDTRRSRDPKTRRPLQHVLQQGGLANTCLAAQNEYLTLSRTSARYQAEHLALGASAAHAFCRMVAHHSHHGV
jgi:hypothetical protein